MMSHTGTPTIESTRRQWEAAAEGWNAYSPMLHSWLGSSTRTLFDAAGVAAGQSVLDIAAGAGDQTMMLADRIGAEGRILATDLSPELINRLKRNASQARGGTIEGRVADAQEAFDEREAFDAAVCRLGLMLMPKPALCLAAVYAALRPKARFAALVFAEPDTNPCIRILMSTALRHAGLPPRDPFAPGGLLSLGRPGDLDRLFETAGFTEVSSFKIEAPIRLPSVDEYITFLRAAAAPVIAVLSGLEAKAQEAAWQDMREQLSVYGGPTGWVGPNTLLITAGRK